MTYVRRVHARYMLYFVLIAAIDAVESKWLRRDIRIALVEVGKPRTWGCKERVPSGVIAYLLAAADQWLPLVRLGGRPSTADNCRTNAESLHVLLAVVFTVCMCVCVCVFVCVCMLGHQQQTSLSHTASSVNGEDGDGGTSKVVTHGVEEEEAGLDDDAL